MLTEPSAATCKSLHVLLDPILRSALTAASLSIDLSSPYIGASTTLWMEKLVQARSTPWRILTRLDPVAAAYGSLHLQGISDLAEAGVNIRHLDNLHAKVFLTEVRGFVGSANLTSAGLGSSGRANRELTVELSDDQRRDVQDIFDQWFDAAEPVTAAMIKACREQAAKVPTRVPRTATQAKADKSRADHADDLLDHVRDGHTWVKAVYRDVKQADEAEWGPGSFLANSGAGRPKFQIDDLIVLYAVGPRRCYAVVRVTGDTTVDRQAQLNAGIPAGDADRWTWVTPVIKEAKVGAAGGFTLDQLGLTGQSLQRGYCRLPIGGMTTALRLMSESDSP